VSITTMSVPADEQLLLNLLNSTPVVDGRIRDELGDLAEAERWLVANGQSATKQEWQALVELRAILQRVVRGDETPRGLAPFLAGVGCRPEVTDEGIEWVLDLPRGRVAAVKAAIAWDTLRTSSPGRLRACANPECRLFLIDRSKPNSAKWCSMALCGNRLKARRHYQRAGEAAVRG
jgi:predicted RNA-binding Zn ribbon-like protein